MPTTRETYELGQYSGIVRDALAKLKEDRVMARIWDHDHTVWKPEPDEITNRLGWLDSPDNMSGVVLQIVDQVNRVREAGYDRALLLGMGGSSLAPEVFRETFGVADGYLDLSVLDSTDPTAVADQAEVHDPARTLFIVSTKSGTTAETLSFFKYFYNRTVDTVGSDRAGEHFIAITDPDSPLEKTALENDFRHVFINDPNIGGRYSALSYFGLVPAALVGVDLPTLLERASTLAVNCEAANCPVKGNNTGAILGSVMGTLAMEGMDKLTVLTSPAISTFGSWLEQLLAESTGKEGKGILPVEGETPGPVNVYGKDRMFAYLRLQGDDIHDDLVNELANNGYSVCRINLKDIYDLGGEFFRWEMATVVAGHIMGINPFDQPNVESAKIQARRMLDEYRRAGKLPEPEPLFETDGITVYSDLKGNEIDQITNAFLSQAGPDNYAAIQAYINPATGASSALNTLRLKIRDRLKIATTLGFGPRFLHSTGQLHKGDGGRGLFIQITADDAMDIPIPDEPGSSTSATSFGVLKASQALGDRQALLDAGRRVIRYNITGDITAGIDRITKAI
jgi:glucose-6-phosphate isomerase